MSCRVVVFISGRGSNLKALLEQRKDFTVEAVLSNKQKAPGLEYAHQHGIEAIVATRKDYDSVLAQKQALYEKVAEIAPDYVLLAGYMQILEEEFIEQYAGRILNIHPSLLPNFPGLVPHKQAIEAGATEHGCTVHIVTKEVDAGPIIAQAKCTVLPGDTEESLASRVLELEHVLYPWVVNNLGAGEISLANPDLPSFTASARADGEKFHFTLKSD
ncbi:MAG: phosphoribosylglycinamide formyltransferase [Bdellovibrionales bacterium]|nr:phosphoribosylglycinamide formyltransferase [Bdellovibrionales bacterium]